MVRNKVFEWIGFIIVIGSIFANASLRAEGITTGTGINLSVIGIIVGAILAFTLELPLTHDFCDASERMMRGMGK